MSRVRTCLWLNHGAKAAAALCLSLLPNSGIDAVIGPDAAGPAFIPSISQAAARPAI
ncbi:MAG: putative 3-demethylubiquinone-9 3-methyltransferase (glyoxalase superfamily) [Bradymonadia bacterium]|jgi:predicted 3-demethylubiquinone-9 3-methyltransferase (glyoxalase superfamily)